MRQHAILFYTCTPPRGNNNRLQNQPLTHTRKKNRNRGQCVFPSPADSDYAHTHEVWDCTCIPSCGIPDISQTLEVSGCTLSPHPTRTHTPQDIGQQILPTMPKQARHPFPGTERISSQRGAKLTQAFPAMGQDIYATQT
ncbi:hypothetical protein KIL84_007757 [Mauremys mutica]|uniref:Uncharacterized protein n=1 Tax=Mauremys mutica TaxID=74926 RepID=A0A9D4AVX6_9SAUR|nr:hypothetical protein KIL84_007757 [Mauremys mutica]